MATPLLLLDLSRVLLAGVMLLYASFMDLRIREVPNWVWAVFAPLGLLLSLLEWLHFRAVDPVWGLALPVLLSTALSFLFFYLGLYGGADAKAFITLSLLTPHPPRTVKPLLGVMSPIYPLTIFTDSTLIAVLFALALLTRNLLWRLRTHRPLFEGLEDEAPWRKGLALLGCMKVEARSIRGPPYQYPAEIVAGGRRRLRLLPDIHDDEAAEETFRVLVEDLGLREVWVSYTLPFLLFISLGFLCSLLLGDLALWILETIF